MTQPANTITELEARLAQPGGASLRDSLAARLRDLETRLRAGATAGLPRNQFPVWQAAINATQAAQETIAQYPACADDATDIPRFPSPY